MKEEESILHSLREQIDRVDDMIFEALEKRMALIMQVGEHKHKYGSAIYRPQREREIIERLAKKQSKYMPIRGIEAIYQEIFALSRNLELPQKVAFLGPIGSYTHQAAEQKFGALSEYIPLNTIQAVFEALCAKRVKYGVVPLENNTNGMVGESVDLLARFDFKIIADMILPIHHSLLSNCEHLGDIKQIFSKDIAFGQCQNFLNAHNLHHIEQIPTDSTARAVQLAASNPNSAAIGSKIAGKIYNLPLMFEHIEDSTKNKTRFIIVSDFELPPSGRDKTSLFVNLKDSDQVGSLFGLLGDFEREGINLTRIDSRPVRNDDNFGIGFFIDCEGHYKDPPLTRLLAKRGDEIKWLGSYIYTDIRE
ncbi:bifunctional chorismate mutase/prephenate dehydratase [Helicobacter marmotae]|uniref:Bifunctional chorismate mutase/prephenate dehydratase n=1 Tax=Helicobacter marmotae TaxID=152490 RepID=A0A3D8I722_9HELI|nr:bifunctional chorismate mutase/prephenate dehydratase [Helicobacter marmotae]RDU60952.1 bifunctional chorismate mutase/prephenate dehydratase [Helicobacter marmotae]